MLDDVREVNSMTSPVEKRLDAAMNDTHTLSLAEISEVSHDALVEIDRLKGLLRSKGIDPGSEYICRCGLRRAPQKPGDAPF